jgi:hypothetical protein
MAASTAARVFSIPGLANINYISPLQSLDLSTVVLIVIFPLDEFTLLLSKEGIGRSVANK